MPSKAQATLLPAFDFDVLLNMLENTDGCHYAERDICFADGLQSTGPTLEGLQRTADLRPLMP